MDTIIVSIIIVIIVGLAAFYVYKAKKNGKRCIGCPNSHRCSGCCSCGENKEES